MVADAGNGSQGLTIPGEKEVTDEALRKELAEYRKAYDTAARIITGHGEKIKQLGAKVGQNLRTHQKDGPGKQTDSPGTEGRGTNAAGPLWERLASGSGRA